MDIIKGKVIGGKKMGKKLGFPTVNVEIGSGISIPAGIYAGIVTFQGCQYKAAIYVREDKIIEAHLLDFSGNLYGEEISIMIEEKIRENMAFRDDKEAVQQITKDVSAVWKYFKKVL